MTQAQRLSKLRSLELTPKEVRQLNTRGNLDINKAKEFFTGDDPRFKDLQGDDNIGKVTDLASLQKLLYGY